MGATRTAFALTPARRVRRAFAAVLLPGFLSLLMVWTAGPAAALTPPPSVPLANAIGEVAGGPEAKIVCAASGVCNIIFGAMAVSALGGLTHDVWMPWVENKIKDMINTPPGSVPFDLITQDVQDPPVNDFGGSFWGVTVKAPPDNVGHRLTGFSAASVCRTAGGIRYQVNKNPSWAGAVYDWNSDSFYWGGGSNGTNTPVGISNTVTGWNTDYTTPPQALDGTTENPARGRSGGGEPQTSADQGNLCNAGDALEGAHIVMQMTAHNGNGYRVFDYGSSANPATGDFSAQTGCRRPDGSTYAKTVSSNAADSPVGAGILIPACDPGDTPTGGSISQGGRVQTTWTNPGSGYSGTGDGYGAPQWYAGTWTGTECCNWNIWHLGDGGATGQQNDSWAFCQAPATAVATLDLGSAKAVGTIRMANNATSSGQPYFTGWTMRTSMDGATWSSAGSVSGRGDPGLGNFTEHRMSSARSARFVELSNFTASASGSCFGASEASVGSPIVDPIPTNTGDSPTPNCVGATPACTWAIWLNGVQCTPTVPGCATWARSAKNNPSSTECHYGPYVMPLASCNWLERSYETFGTPTEIPATNPNTDGDPDTHTAPEPQPQPSPSPTATSTATLQPTPTSTAQPTGTVSASPTATSSATATSTPSVTITNETDCTPATTGGAFRPGTCDPRTETPTIPSDEAECFPHGWGVFNPAEWVMKPVKCALQWAFVPPTLQTDVSDVMDGGKARLDASPIGGWMLVITSWGNAFAAPVGPGGCQGPAVDIGFLSQGTHVAQIQHPFDACSGVKATAAATSRIFLSVAICWFTGWRLVRIVGKPFGYSLDVMNGPRY